MSKIRLDKTAKVGDLWGHLHYLVVLSEKGGFSRAAAHLGVSKAGMSQRIAELERAIGTQLVRRTTRSVNLTEEGLALVRNTQRHFVHIAQAVSTARDADGPPRGLVSVTAPVAFARLKLVPLLPRFFEAYPDVKLKLDISDQVRSLVLDGYDVAIRHTADPLGSHVALSLCGIDFMLVASPEYLKRHGNLNHPSALASHECLNYSRGREWETWYFQANDAASPDRIGVSVNGRLSANSGEALRDAAIAGLGIARLPDFNVESAIRSHDLVQVLPEWKLLTDQGDRLLVLRPYTSQVPKAASAFVDWLRTSFGGSPINAAGTRG